MKLPPRSKPRHVIGRENTTIMTNEFARFLESLFIENNDFIFASIYVHVNTTNIN